MENWKRIVIKTTVHENAILKIYNISKLQNITVFEQECSDRIKRRKIHNS